MTELRGNRSTARETEAIREIGLEIAIAVREVGAMLVNVGWEQSYSSNETGSRVTGTQRHRGTVTALSVDGFGFIAPDRHAGDIWIRPRSVEHRATLREGNESSTRSRSARSASSGRRPASRRPPSLASTRDTGACRSAQGGQAHRKS